MFNNNNYDFLFWLDSLDDGACGDANGGTEHNFVGFVAFSDVVVVAFDVADVVDVVDDDDDDDDGDEVDSSIFGLMLETNLVLCCCANFVHAFASCFGHTIKWFTSLCDNFICSFCDSFRKIYYLLVV